MSGRITVVGLGPAGSNFLSASTQHLIAEHPHVIFRTTVHPAAEDFPGVASFDHLYEAATSFDSLYSDIVETLASMAADHGEVLYCVPGSPLIAEHTVELLMKRDDLEVTVIPAMSFLDLCWSALGIDPVARQVQLLDAHQMGEKLNHGGPLLISQTHSRAVLSDIKLSVDTDLVGDRDVVLLHHLGLDDEVVLRMPWHEMDRFESADHLTSLYVEDVRTLEDASRDLVAMMAQLRDQCPWDQKQTHGSLARHLLEEAYECLEAIEELARCLEQDDAEHLDAAYDHAQEELGDVVFQVVFHAHLAAEEGRFDLAGVFDGVREKLIGRHPHVFGDAVVESADDVAARWEEIKREEKGRQSVTEGIPVALPSLARYVKLRRKALAIGMEPLDAVVIRDNLSTMLSRLESMDMAMDDATASSATPAAELLGGLLVNVAELAHQLGVDPEETLRLRTHELTAAIQEFERTK